MKAFKNLKTSCLAVCLMLAVQVSSYSMEQMCAQWSGTGYIGNPSNCKGWGYCKNQQLIGWGVCNTGYVFDSQAGECGKSENTICSTSALDSCKSLQSPSFVSDPNNCTQYAYCSGTGSMFMQSCPTNQVFAANNDTCVYGPACPQDTICRFMQSDIFVGDPNNCGQFLQCLNGYGRSGQCNNGLKYNLETNLCQKDDPCTGTGPGTITPDGTPSSTNSTICAIYWNATITTPTQYVSDNTTCFGYYYCPTKDGEGTWNTCPTGLQFDSSIQKCVSPASFPCPFNRCGNMNIKFMAAPNTNCTSYVSCSGSYQIGECPPGHQFFDEISGNCVPDEPEYAICHEEAKKL